MAFDDQAIREGLATALLPLDIRVSPYTLTNPTAPCAYVLAGNIDYLLSGGSGVQLEYRVVVLEAYDTSAETDVAAQQGMARHRSVHGVPALVQADPTLGGSCDDAVVAGSS